MPSHLSHSQLTTWLRCAKAYFLERKAYAPTVPAVYLVAGSAVHEIIERMTLAHAGQGPQIEDLKAEWEREFTDAVAKETLRTNITPDQWRKGGRPTKDKPNGEDVQWWRENGLTQCEKYGEWMAGLDWTLADINGTPGAETPFEIDLAGVTIKGFIDSTWERIDNELIVVDAKTGSRSPESVLQVGLYATAIEMMTGKRPLYGAFYMTRTGTLTPLEDLRRFDATFWEKVFGQLEHAVSNEIFIPHLGSHCRSCSVKDACFAAGGVDAYRYDPMHPKYLPSKQDAN